MPSRRARFVALAKQRAQEERGIEVGPGERRETKVRRLARHMQDPLFQAKLHVIGILFGFWVIYRILSSGRVDWSVYGAEPYTAPAVPDLY